jgi:hypothetical protein
MVLLGLKVFVHDESVEKLDVFLELLEGQKRQLLSEVCLVEHILLSQRLSIDLFPVLHQ